MKRNHLLQKLLILSLAILMTLSLFPATSLAAENSGAPDLFQKGIRIGDGSGTVQELLVKELYPEADICYYQHFDGYAAVAQGKIDAFIFDKKQMLLAIESGLHGVRVLNQTIGEPTRIALGISNASAIPDLEKQINRFIREIRQDGTLEELYDRWVIRKEYAMPVISQSVSPKHHLIVGTTGISEPYSFYENGSLTGYDIELMYRFAAWLDADVEFLTYDYAGVVQAAQTGRVDIVAANLQITPERAEALTFSDILYEEENGIMVRDTGAFSNAQTKSAVRWQDYNGKRLGVLVGPLMEDAAAEFFPESEYLLFNSYPDCAAALLAGKIDGFLSDEPGMISMHAEMPEIDYIHESLTENNYAFAFRKDDPDSAALCAELDEFLSKSWADGTMQEIGEIWLGVDEERKVVDMSGLTGENGTVRVVTTSTDMPWSYIKDGKNVGYDIDLVARFCRERGYALELGDVDFAGRIPAVQSGKYDFTTDMNVTPEREEQVLFSSPTAHGSIVLAVLASDLAPASAASDGGDGVYQSLDELAGKRIGVMQGTYFDVLVSKRIPDIDISYYLSEADEWNALRTGKIDGFVCEEPTLWQMLQEEDSLCSLPEYLEESQFGFVFPKSEEGLALNGQFNEYLRRIKQDFLPAYKGEIVSLIKATAIVGYIAVQDLTKMGDIVRGRTYEAFFPLIAVAVIYFILAGILTFLVGKIELNINPRRRRKEDILKGVQNHD